MAAKVFTVAGRLFSFLGTLVWTALLGVAALAAWHFYQDEHLRGQLESHGQAVTVRVEHADRTRRQVWDNFGNFIYVGFTYHGRPYEARCVSDTAWLAPGDQLALRYLPQQDVFGQLGPSQMHGRDPAKSRLLRWSVMPDVSPENRALLLFGLLLVMLFFVVSGLLASLTGWRGIPAIARPVGFVVLALLAGYCTYDAVAYYRYAAALQRDGRPQEVLVQHADQHNYFTGPMGRRKVGRGRLSDYIYAATFLFQGQPRTVAIEEAEYERLKAGATRLAVRYDAARDDFIAADYSPRWEPVLPPLVLWLLVVLLLRRSRKPAAQPTRADASPPQYP
jgi:hypothetical protein